MRKSQDHQAPEHGSGVATRNAHPLEAPEEAKATFETEHIRLPDDLIPVEAELPHQHLPPPELVEEHLEETDLPEKQSAATLSQWQLIALRFSRHYLAVGSLFILMVLYSLAIFAEFCAPYTRSWNNVDMIYAPPQLPKFSFQYGFYTNRIERQIDPISLKNYYTKTDDIVPLGFFVRGEPYKLWGLIPTDRHFFGAHLGGENSGTFYFLGADKYGRDVLSRLIYGARISLSIGIVSIIATFLLGATIGGISGYVGGTADTFIQRAIEVINSFPHLPLWLAFAAVLPSDWSPIQTYFAITIVLSLLGWTGLARVVRGKILSLREEDYAVAARLLGASHSRIIFRHLLPGFTSHIIVSLSLSVPGMILGETALSFLGLGLRPPVVSWGVMLQDCLNIDVVANYPWLLMPVVFIILTVLSFNFFGDGMRDAADPYSSK
ncbi:MAG: ABC transporter permease [Armatimonadota bacterium]|nr:ABC transporter permease [Armatimonadota bacterium]